MYNTVASPDPNPRGGVELPNPNNCSSTLMTGTRGEALTAKSNECNSTLTSGTSGAQPPPIPYKLGEGASYLTLASAILR